MRTKLISSFLLIVLTAIGIFFAVTIRQTAQEVRNFIDRRGLTGSEMVVTELEEYYGRFGSWSGVDDLLRSSPRVPPAGVWGTRKGLNHEQDQDPAISGVHLRLINSDGFLIAQTRKSTPVGNERLTQLDLARAVPLDVDGEIVGYLLADMGQGFSPANEISLLSRLNRAAIIAVGSAGLVAVILALLLSYGLVRPVRDLTHASSKMAAGDLTQRVNVRGNDEVANLGRTFNDMAESLQIAEESRKAMTADIAHELRTPLSVQRAHLEAIEDNVYPMSSESLSTIEEQNKLLTRLVDDLGTLALADAGQLRLQKSETNFPKFLRRVTAPFIAQAADRGIDVILSLADCPPLEIDSQRIQQIINNLLNNALRYTPDRGRIFCHLGVTLVPQSDVVTQSKVGHSDKVIGWAALEIRDTGPGIPTESLGRIFDRFYRADKSRARAEGGTGLGLSIARKIAQAHGGNLTAGNLSSGGAVFTLTLPIK